MAGSAGGAGREPAWCPTRAAGPEGVPPAAQKSAESAWATVCEGALPRVSVQPWGELEAAGLGPAPEAGLAGETQLKEVQALQVGPALSVGMFPEFGVHPSGCRAWGPVGVE